MNNSLVLDDTFVSHFILFSVNDSESCERTEAEPELRLYTFYRIMCLILGPVNAILNGFCVHIFRHAVWKKTAMSRILKGLSVIELCMGVSLFLHALIFSQNTETRSAEDQGHGTVENSMAETRLTFLHTITSFLLTMVFSRCLLSFQVARNWSVVLLAAYRYDKVCRPIGTGTALPRKRIRIILIAIVLLSFLIVLPRVFEVGIIVCSRDGRFGADKFLLLKSKIYQIVYLGVVMFVVQSGGPVICVCVLSAFVIRLIAKRRKIHKMNEEKSARSILSKQHNTRVSGMRQNETSALHSSVMENELKSNKLVLQERPAPSGDKLIFALCITFFILETPAFFSKILSPYLEEKYQTADLILSVSANILIYLDSTLNAFVYMASNPTFRKIAYEQCMKYKSRLLHSQNTRSTSYHLNNRNCETQILSE